MNELVIDQKVIDDHYRQKKEELRAWMTEFIDSLKRITKTQRSCLNEYAENISFSKMIEVNSYISSLSTVSNRDKKKFQDYINQIDWLPTGINTGILDGNVVSRVLESPLEKFLGDKEWKSQKE